VRKEVREERRKEGRKKERRECNITKDVIGSKRKKE
jgi:hypothetical protein